MDFDALRERFDELRENLSDPYWRADHPEVMATAVAVITGIIGLMFAVIQIFIERKLTPDG